jgi:ferredoxin-type protein NapH
MTTNWKEYGYLILVIYLGIGFLLFPSWGSIALICMLVPVILAAYEGRSWCGNYCPRGSLWDNLLAKVNSKKEIPAWARTKFFRLFMVLFIFAVFGWQMFYAWPELSSIGLVFLRIILITTLVGLVLALVYSPRTWCSFCPMGTFAALVSEGKNPIIVDQHCVSCGLCARACPMGLEPNKAPNKLFAHPDCIKCGACITSCPKHALQFVKGVVKRE